MLVKFVSMKGSDRVARNPFYVALVQHERTLSKREFYDLAAEYTGYKATAVKAVFMAAAEFVRENQARGNITFLDGVASIRNYVRGSFDALTGPWVKGRNYLSVKAVAVDPFKTLLAAIVPVNNTEGSSPVINTVLDETTMVYDVITGTDVFSIAGAELALDATRDDEYVALVNAQGVETKCTVDFSDLPGESLTNLQSQVSALSAVMNTGGGHGMLVPEMYLGTKRTETDADAEESRVLAYVESVRAAMPSGPAHVVHLFGGWLTLGAWSSDSSPEADIKVRYDRYLRRLATDPAFADVGGAGMSTLACDEEIARWTARIFHHYCIEGRTDSLAEKMGWCYRPEIVANGDFMDGLAGWHVDAAEGGAITTERRVGYGGKRGQCRMARSDTEIGEHFAIFTRSGKAPNRLSQTLRNIVPGKAYKLVFCTADYDDVVAPGTRTAERAFCAEMEGGEIVPELSWDTAEPDAKSAAKARRAGRPPHCVTVTHRIVFRAVSSAPTLTFMDWTSREERGGAAGGRQLVNFVRVAPYYGEL